MSTTTIPTPEGLRCAACSHFIILKVGAYWDACGDALCASCASCAGLLNPRNRAEAEHAEHTAREAAAAAAAAEEEAAEAAEALIESEAQASAASDLASATAYLQRLLHAGDESAAELTSQMAAEGVSSEWVQPPA